MKVLIAEDDFTSRLLLQEMLKDYGLCHLAMTGKEAVTAVEIALRQEEPYDLICLDIMMPEMDGQQALKEIRAKEKEFGVPEGGEAKIIMTTAVCDIKNVTTAFYGLCDAYLTKPVVKQKLFEELRGFGLIENE